MKAQSQMFPKPMDPQMAQMGKIPMQTYSPMYFQQAANHQKVNGDIRMNPYARYYNPGMNMMGYGMPMGAMMPKAEDKKDAKGPQPFPQHMYYPPGPWGGGYMMPQQMMRAEGAEQRPQVAPMIPPMGYPMMQNAMKAPPNPGQPLPQMGAGPKMGMYMPYQMDPRYNPYASFAHQMMQKKP